MASSAPPSPFRQLVEERLTQLTADFESLFADVREKGRREFADQLNQAVRRMRLAPDLEELAATIVDAASAFAAGAALLRVEGETARGERIRGVAEETAGAFDGLEISLASAAAMAGAVESRDPVTTVTSEAEVSATLVALLHHLPDGRAMLFPLVVREHVPALLYVWGEVQPAAVELLSQVGAAVWSALDLPAPPEPEPEPEPAPELVQIAGGPAAPAMTWESLTPAEQEIHLRAQRFARVQVAEMRLYDSETVQGGRAGRNVYGALKQPIDAARDKFRRMFFAGCPSMVDYLHLELVRTLANDDQELLGKDYPGPMV